MWRSPGAGMMCKSCLPPASNPMTTPTVSRNWATPLVMGCFTLMAATGVMLFFHWHSPLQKDIHTWLGWGLVAAVAVHVLSNLAAFKRHFTGHRRALVLLLVAVAVFTATSFVRPADGGKGGSAANVAMQALSRAPLRALAEVFGLSVGEARDALAGAGLTLANDNASLDAVAQGNRDQVSKGLKALAAASRKPAPR
ncbi:hypothetical protein DBR42_20555 [Pelomonas sp. HMWF004]|nr:hypothetical protein DBR42_20555 [Pelomonas sp. HMWF004]